MSDPSRHSLGRPRPPHEPRTIQCASCGSPVSVKDERAVLLVCGACGSALELSGTEIVVLSRKKTRFNFPLELDAPFKWRGHRWRVTARLALIEDGDLSEVTRVYYLYSPRRGPLILDEYKNRWTLSWDTHVQPLEDPLARDDGDRLETGDGRRWVCTDCGTYEVHYVDGALPWLQKVGDRIRYAEFRAADGSGDLFDAEGQGSEVEVAFGRLLTPEQVREATGNPKLSASVPSAAERLADAVPSSMSLVSMLMVALLGALFNGVLYIYAKTGGSVVLKQDLSPAQLSDEVLSQPFKLDDPDTVVQVEVEAYQLQDAWMAVDLALVKGEETVVHVDDLDVEYYSGVEGGERWSEGSRDAEVLVEVPDPGVYHVLVRAVSNMGETETASSALHPLRLRVKKGALPTLPAIVGLAICGVIAGVLVLLIHHRHEND